MPYGSIGGAQNQAAAQEIRPASHVQSQMSRSQALVEDLKSTVSQLEARLCGVLRERGKEIESGGLAKQQPATPRPILVGHADALSNQNDQLMWLLDELRSILDRIEL